MDHAIIFFSKFSICYVFPYSFPVWAEFPFNSLDFEKLLKIQIVKNESPPLQGCNEVCNDETVSSWRSIAALFPRRCRNQRFLDTRRGRFLYRRPHEQTRVLHFGPRRYPAQKQAVSKDAEIAYPTTSGKPDICVLKPYSRKNATKKSEQVAKPQSTLPRLSFFLRAAWTP